MNQYDESHDVVADRLERHDIDALCRDPRIALELTWLGDEVMAGAPRTRRRRRWSTRTVAVATAAFLGLGGTAVAAAATSGFGLFAGYVGDDELVDTTTWGPRWQEGIDGYAWPPGFVSTGYVDGKVLDGRARPDAVPSRDIDHEVLALNACAWTTAYERRVTSEDRVGMAEAVQALENALDEPSSKPFLGEPVGQSIATLTSASAPTRGEVVDFLSTWCGKGLTRAAVEGVR